MSIARTAARVTIGALFVGHGTQKLFGWFDGPGLDGFSGVMEKLDMLPARQNAQAAGYAEAVGGALLALGLGTPLAAGALAGTMITAMRKVHLPNGPWVSEGGYEYNLVLIAAVLALAEDGPGPVSLDSVLGLEKTGPLVALGALGLGAAASTLAIELGRRHRAATPADPAASDPVVAPA